MSRTIRTLLVALATLLLAACNAPEADGGQPPKGGGPNGTPPGLLVAEGTGFIHTFDLPGGDTWSERLSYAAPWSTVVVHEDRRELLIASTSGSEPVIIEVYDIDTFGLKDAFEWPDSTAITKLFSLAATDDGAYLALVMEPLLDKYLEVIERDTGRVVYRGLGIATGATMAWTPDDQLVIPIALSHENDPARWGAIAAFPLANLKASTNGD